jgi:hypothetical protein
MPGVFTRDGRQHDVNKKSFPRHWATVPLVIYVIGILLPVVVAFLRVKLMTAVGVPLYAVLFWTGPFASAATVFWSSWSPGWRVVWVMLIPAFVAITFIALMI